MVNELHRILLTGTRGDSYETGRVRDRQNWIGPRDGTIEDSEFVPPPPGDVLGRRLDAWERWIQEEEALRTIRALQEHRTHTLETLRSEGVRGLAIQIVEDLIGNPYVKVTGVADRHGRSYQAANNAIATLVEHGVLREITGRSYDRTFAATEVFRLVSSET